MIQDWIYLLALGGGALLILGGGTLKNVVQSQAWRLRMWRDAATACNLNVVRSTRAWAWRLRLEAKAGPLEVRIEGAQPGNVGTQIVVVVPRPPGFREVRIRRETWGQRGMPEIETGDEAFDRVFFIEGPTRLVCMLLDAEIRGLLLRANATSQVKIVNGELQAKTLDVDIDGVLPILLDLGQRFTQKVDVLQCLIDNVLRDPAAGVRLSSLVVLVLECARGPRTDEVLRIACADQDSKVRLRAAIELGPEGHGVLMELAESAQQDDVSAQAVRALGRELPFERTTALLQHALGVRRMQTARACLETLGSSGTAEAVDLLAKVLAQEKVLGHEENEILIAAAQALGTTANPAAEAPLLLALRHPRLDLRIAAARALGRVGSVAAVLPLKEAARLSWPDLTQAIRQAIAEIQYRQPGASPGQLSLAGTEAGQLSLAQAETGQLSLAAEAGQLSLSAEEERER
ncbi:MAG TPA: HEAT repeat domain-containing protein [Thermoanaerobaculia bacterium]